MVILFPESNEAIIIILGIYAAVLRFGAKPYKKDKEMIIYLNGDGDSQLFPEYLEPREY